MERSGPLWSPAGLLAVLLVCTCVGGVCGRTEGCLQGSQNISTLLETNTTITLKHGNYCVERFVQIVNKMSFSLSSDNGNPNDVVIRCADGVGVGFHNISDQLVLSGVTISGCGMVNDTLNVFLDSVNETLNMYYTALTNTSVAVVIAASHNVMLSDMRVSNNIGFGLLAVSLYGTNTFSNVEFSQNVPSGPQDVPLEILHAGNRLGGGVVFQFHDWRTNPNEVGNVTVVIENSHFSNNTNYYSTEIVSSYMKLSPTLQEIGYTLSGAAGITVKLCQLHYSVNFVVRNSSINGNKALNAGGAAISTFQNVMNSRITFVGCSFNDNTYSTSNSVGMGLTLSLDLWYWNSTSEPRGDVYLFFDSCKFVGNDARTGGALYVAYSPGIASELLENIVFENCLFHQNRASAGSAVTVHTVESVAISPSHHLTFDGCEFSSNTVTAPSTFSASLIGAGAIQIKNTLIELKDTIIKDTNGSGIQCVDSTVIVSGNVTFSNNSAVYGGGAQMIGYSYFVATNHSKLIFRRNTAYQTGGGIYYTLPQNVILSSSFDCFLYFDTFDPYCIKDCTFLDLDFVLSFEDNTALLGTMIYGAVLDTCIWSYTLSVPFGPGGVNKNHTIELLSTYYNDTFQFDQPLRPTGVNTNAVDPMVKVKENDSSMWSVMPGEQFTVTGNAIDLLGNTVSDVMLAVIDNQYYVNDTPTTHATVGSDGLWRIRGNSESSLRVSGPKNFTAVVSVTSSLSHASSSLNVHLTNCQPGFNYSSDTYQCECDELLLNQDYIKDNFRCNATNGSFSVRNGYWFGNLNGGNTLVDNYVSQYVLSPCGSFYCDNPLYRRHRSEGQPVSLPVGGFQYVNPDDLDSQCLPNRNGLLCGQCKEGFSVVLGTLRCKECTNSFGIFFIVLFAALGILLMCVVTISDFHVSGGYINGLILYSNIIDIYYHELVKRNIPYGIFVIYEWLSLRWGIPVCFFQGLDPLAQAGLEFVFPIYMGLLLIITTLVARYCPIPQRYRNAINLPKMFATMLFLTFGAVLGSSIRILSFVVVYTASGPPSWPVRWRGDPNILYFKDARHIILAVMSIAAIVYLIGTTTLLIIPEKFCCLTWCRRQQRKWKPISDVFQAPFRKPYFCRTWEGWRLLFRVLVIFVGFLPISVHLWVLLLILLIFHSIQSALHPHARQIRNWLDSYFILTLLVTFFFYIGLDAFNISSNDVIFLVPFYLLQTSVFISMVVIFVKCFFRCLKKLYRILRKCFGKKEGLDAERLSESNTLLGSSTLVQNGEDAEQDGPPGETLQVTESDVQVKNYGSLRHSLLIYDSDQEEEMTNVSQ